MPIPDVADERSTDAPEPGIRAGRSGYEPIPQDDEPDKDIFTKLHRGVCSSACPDHDVTLNSDGTAAYTGGRFAPGRCPLDAGTLFVPRGDRAGAWNGSAAVRRRCHRAV